MTKPLDLERYRGIVVLTGVFVRGTAECPIGTVRLLCAGSGMYTLTSAYCPTPNRIPSNCGYVGGWITFTVTGPGRYL